MIVVSLTWDFLLHMTLNRVDLMFSQYKWLKAFAKICKKNEGTNRVNELMRKCESYKKRNAIAVLFSYSFAEKNLKTNQGGSKAIKFALIRH